MIRTKHFTISIFATLAVTAALAAPAPAYESVNAATNPASSEDAGPAGGYTSVNAAVSESAPAAGTRVSVSSPNAILGGGNVAEPVLATSTPTSTSGFDWNDALVGAGSVLVLGLFTAGAMLLVRRRRAPRVQPTI